MKYQEVKSKKIGNGMEEKIDFWYESNSYFGRIKNLEDLRIAISYVVDKKFGQLENKDEFLDLSTQHYSGSMDFDVIF